MSRFSNESVRIAISVLLAIVSIDAPSLAGEIKAASGIVDITPETFPAIVNGGMLSRSITKVKTRLNARAIALSNDRESVVIVVVDSCMLPRPLLDEIKSEAAERYAIRHDHILISATHCHSAPSCMGALGTDEDPNYIPQLKRQVVELIGSVLTGLVPAEVGYGSVNAAEFTALRRWIRRPDRIALDPFGNPTVRANMHAAGNWDDVTGPSGPEDPELSLFVVRSQQGKPIGVLANFSMHYFGDSDISADYFGLFCEELCGQIGADENCVAIMSHGCSGDIWKRDYALPTDKRGDDQGIADYAKELAQRAIQAYQSVEYSRDVPIEMLETRMSLRYRTPDLQRLEWAKRIVENMDGGAPSTTTEVYAREQILLDERQSTEVVLQGLRIGDIAIATTPNETYAISGLKIKAASPFKHTMVIELANGGDGYIPPPEQHLLGGYNTWAARSAGLEIEAEPKIIEGAIVLLEKLAGMPRVPYQAGDGPAAEFIQKQQPVLWWELDEFRGPRAHDRSGNRRDGIYEGGVAYFVEGPQREGDNGESVLKQNRSVMFAGGRVQGNLDQKLKDYTISFWIWNGMPAEAREITGWLFSCGKSHGQGPFSHHFGVLGVGNDAGRLAIFEGDSKVPVAKGNRSIERWRWHHIAIVHQEDTHSVYLDGHLEIKLDGELVDLSLLGDFFFGGKSSGESSWEGRLDQLAIFPKAFSIEEVARLTQ